MDHYDDYIPCYRKSGCETSAIKQLLSVSSSGYPKEYGDTGYINVTTTTLREKRQTGKKKETLNEPTEGTGDEDEPVILTSADIYKRLGGKENNGNVAFDFCSWQLCPTVHAETVKFGIADPSRLKPHLRTFNPTRRKVTSASKLSTRASTSPSRLKTCQSFRLNSQRPGSVASRPSSSSAQAKREELGVWQEPPPLMPIQYSFKYLKHPRLYSDQYRETYTYSKIRERGFTRTQFVTGVAVPRARTRCVNGRESRSKATTSKHLPSSTPMTSEPGQDRTAHPYLIACKEGDKAYHIEPNDTTQSLDAITWQLNQQLLESCDVALSVNNPSPTEIAMLSKIPHIHRSSPSIPSNTNGKYGGKGTDKPYPFQLNISADAQTVIAPSVKKVGRSIYIH